LGFILCHWTLLTLDLLMLVELEVDEDLQFDQSTQKEQKSALLEVCIVYKE
jgi:hypothetical protein